MAQALGHVVVAEGIERPEQAAALRALGCELGQGYLFSRPVPADEADRFVGTSVQLVDKLTSSIFSPIGIPHRQKVPAGAKWR